MMKTRQFIAGLLAAVSLALTLAIARPVVAFNPLCVGVEEGSLEWYLFFCYLDPPPKEPKV